MAVKRVIDGVHVVPMGLANAFLIEGDDGLTLIDAGYPGKEAVVFGAIRGLGRSPDQLILPIAGGIEVIHVPGHCAGQMALLWLPGRMLFAGDVCTNVMGLGDPVGFENLNDGRASQRRLASLSFDAAGFGHGPPIARDASTRFRDKWGAEEGRNKRAA
jgi:glyoxylase-like metal-dependent hydrolase (beta-lactamase superfamily II)